MWKTKFGKIGSKILVEKANMLLFEESCVRRSSIKAPESIVPCHSISPHYIIFHSLFPRISPVLPDLLAQQFCSPAGSNEGQIVEWGVSHNVHFFWRFQKLLKKFHQTFDSSENILCNINIV